MGFLGEGVKGETSLSYEHSWGQGGSETKAVTVGSTAAVTVSLDLGQVIRRGIEPYL